MIRKISVKLSVLAILVLFVFSTQLVHAGIFDDMQLWFKERNQISQNSKVVSNNVKSLYRERKSIQAFATSANSLVQAYKSISNKSFSGNLPKLLEIAKAISVTFKEYNNLAPKFTQMYKNSASSLKYFSDLANRTDTISAAKNVVKRIPNDRLNSLAGAQGWGRVFSAVKENPINLFKWGRLKDEYDLGKVEAKYPLKCAQIGIEAVAYFNEAKNSINELIGIKSEIEKIMGGSLDAILNIGKTMEKVQNSGKAAERLGNIAQTGAVQLTKRFGEFIDVQNEYSAALTKYNTKYNQPPASSNGTASSPTISYGNTTSGSNSASASSGTSSTSAAKKISVQDAMAYYQKAYEGYIKIANNQNASQAEINQAIAQLQKAKQILQQVKAAQ